MTVLEFLKGDNSNARVGALRLMRDLNLDFIEMFPRVIQTHLKDGKAKNLNALHQKEAVLDRYKNVILSWDLRPNWMEGLTDEEREQLRESARLMKRVREEKEE
jgi:hypothetical protein